MAGPGSLSGKFDDFDTSMPDVEAPAMEPRGRARGRPRAEIKMTPEQSKKFLRGLIYLNDERQRGGKGKVYKYQGFSLTQLNNFLAQVSYDAKREIVGALNRAGINVMKSKPFDISMTEAKNLDESTLTEIINIIAADKVSDLQAYSDFYTEFANKVIKRALKPGAALLNPDPSRNRRDFLKGKKIAYLGFNVGQDGTFSPEVLVESSEKAYDLYDFVVPIWANVDPAQAQAIAAGIRVLPNGKRDQFIHLVSNLGLGPRRALQRDDYRNLTRSHFTLKRERDAYRDGLASCSSDLKDNKHSKSVAEQISQLPTLLEQIRKVAKDAKKQEAIDRRELASGWLRLSDNRYSRDGAAAQTLRSELKNGQYSQQRGAALDAFLASGDLAAQDQAYLDGYQFLGNTNGSGARAFGKVPRSTYAIPDPYSNWSEPSVVSSSA